MTDREERVLVLAPVGRDATLAQHALCRVGIAAEVCSDIDAVCREIAHGAGVVLLTQEAINGHGTERLLATLDDQPPWSDLPVVVLVSRDAAASVLLHTLLGGRVNATFLERPTGAATLVRAVEMGLRARRRQYELRDYLLALASAQEAEHEARALAEEAVRSRDEFLTSVAHDLKNPLGAIKGYAQLLQRRLRTTRGLDPLTIEEQLRRIEGMADRTSIQIDELLDAARLQAGQPLPLNLAPVDLSELVERVAAEWQGASPLHSIHVERVTTELLGVWDARRLERVLSNLIGNAIKYSPEGGQVTIRTCHEPDGVVLVVQDGGIGIPAQDLPHVFERFYRASNATGLEGTGLGLAGVRQIVEQHGGSIAIESDEGRGTRVTVRLPVVQDVPEARTRGG
jgi:signal transduction histidine kinase